MKEVLLFVLLVACVDRIDFDVPSQEFQTVIEGMISDSPGPYTVRISKGLSLNSDFGFRTPVRGATVRLFDDAGVVENLTETLAGVYMTGGLIQGKIGHQYHIEGVTAEGKNFESAPDRLNPVGELESIRYEFEPRVMRAGTGELPANIFKIVVDATTAGSTQNFMRWRFKGTYKVETFPQLHTDIVQNVEVAAPLPCSGYIISPEGLLLQVRPCTCCICWVTQFDAMPTVSDDAFISGGKFRNVKVAEVSVTSRTFYEKYQLEIEQMSLSRTAFEFLRLIRAQREGASNLFQPPYVEIKGNVFSSNSSEPMLGLFWATSTTKKSIVIPRTAVPYRLAPIDTVTIACTTYSNSTTTQPPSWP